MVEEFGDDQVFPLPNVDSRILSKIIRYLLEDVSIQETRDDLFSIAVAVDYMQMDELLDEVCKEIANLLKGKSPKEIRSILNIEDPSSVNF